MRKRYFIFLVPVIWLLSIVNCSKPDTGTFFRIGFFPDLRNQNSQSFNLFFSDYLALQCKLNQSNNMWVIPPEWIASSIEFDSVASTNYIKKHFLRIGLHQAFLINSFTYFENEYKVTMIKYDFNQHITDTLLYRGSLNYITHQLFKKLSINIENSQTLKINMTHNESFKRIENALSTYLTGSYAEAAIQWQHLTEINSTSSYCKTWLIKSLLQNALVHKSKKFSSQHLYFQIAKELAQLQAIDSTQYWIHPLKGQYFLHQEMWNQAESSLKLANDKFPHDPSILLDISQMHPSRYAHLGFQNKESILQYIIKIYPGLDEAWLELSQYYYMKKQIQKAEATCQAWLTIHPSSMDALLALGKLYLLTDNIPRLIETYEEILTLDPQSVEAFYNLGIAYYRDKQFETSKRFFLRAIEIGQHPNAYYYLGILAYNKADTIQARQYFQKRIQLRTGMHDEFADESIRMIQKLDQLNNKSEL